MAGCGCEQCDPAAFLVGHQRISVPARRGLHGPAQHAESNFSGVGEQSEGWTRVADRVALRFPDPEGRRDLTGWVIPHDLFSSGHGPMESTRLTTVPDESGIRSPPSSRTSGQARTAAGREVIPVATSMATRKESKRGSSSSQILVITQASCPQRAHTNEKQRETARSSDHQSGTDFWRNDQGFLLCVQVNQLPAKRAEPT